MDRFARSHFAAATLFASARQHAGLEIASMADLLADLAEIDAHKHSVPAGYESMKAHCLAELPYTTDEAGNRIRAARVAREYPMIFPMLVDGRLLLTAVLRLAPYLTQENADRLLAAAAYKTKPELEALLAERFPRSEMFSWMEEPPSDCEENHEGVPERPELPEDAPTAMPATVTPLSAHSFGAQFTMSREEYALVRRSRELSPAGDDKEVFMRAQKAHVAQMENRKYGATDKPARSPRQTRSARSVPAHARRAVRERDGECAFVSDTGNRCTAREHLQFDHIVPVAQGGEATVSNIRLLCRAHDQYEAERVYGAEFMRKKRKAAVEAGEQRKRPMPRSTRTSSPAHATSDSAPPEHAAQRNPAGTWPARRSKSACARPCRASETGARWSCAPQRCLQQLGVRPDPASGPAQTQKNARARMRPPSPGSPRSPRRRTTA